MRILGIESSCDETAAAIVDSGHVVANVVHSQIPIHAKYGGVVPELASRNHVMAILPVVDKVLRELDIQLADIDGLAVTAGPGLVGSLLVGLETAKMLAYLTDLPLFPVHHIEGHILSPFCDPETAETIQFPFVSLVVSGGHTSLFLVEDYGKYTVLGQTLDDAAGEAFDKVAKRLGGPYPGGPWIQKEGADGDPTAFDFPRPLQHRGLDFSFSGLKTSASNRITALERETPDRKWQRDLCAGVQDAIVDVLLLKALRACAQHNCSSLAIGGGVACNSALRSEADKRCSAAGITVSIPGPRFCADNAAMIAFVGWRKALQSNASHFAEHHLDVNPGLPLTNWGVQA